jgi:CcmD family protein
MGRQAAPATRRSRLLRPAAVFAVCGEGSVTALTPAQLELLSREPRMPAALREQLRKEASELRLAQPPTRPADDGFKPVSELPPEEKLPAAPMLVAAYVFVALALFAYVLSLARRLNAVSREIGRIDAQLKQR